MRFCHQVDQEEGGRGIENADLEENEDWLEKSMLVSEKKQKLKKIGEVVVEIENRMGRIEAVLKGEYEVNIKIAKQSNSKSGNRRAQEKCDSLICCICSFDCTISWVQCDSCDQKPLNLS